MRAASLTRAAVSVGWLANSQSSIASALPFSRARRTETAASHEAMCAPLGASRLHSGSSG